MVPQARQHLDSLQSFLLLTSEQLLDEKAGPLSNGTDSFHQQSDSKGGRDDGTNYVLVQCESEFYGRAYRGGIMSKSAGLPTHFKNSFEAHAMLSVIWSNRFFKAPVAALLSAAEQKIGNKLLTANPKSDLEMPNVNILFQDLGSVSQ